MTKRTTLLILDATAFAFFAVLMSWRLTGLVLHEWIGLAIVALIVVHLMVHWGWVETRVGALVRRHRRFGALLLNGALFVAMGAVLVSGIVISKVVFPRGISPAAYLRWHGIHETSSNFVMWLVAFHVAYNWDRIKGSLRHALGRAQRIPARALHRTDIEWGLAGKRLLWVAGVSAALTAAVVADARWLGGNERIEIRFADGRRQVTTEPPAGITQRNTQYDWPQLGSGAARRFITAGVVMLVFGMTGRYAMTRRRRRDGTAPSAPALSTGTE